MIVSSGTPDAVSHWSMTTLRDRLVKIGAKIVRHGRSITFQTAEVMASRDLPRDLVRISAGIEDEEDMIADLDQALSLAKQRVLIAIP